MEIKPCPKCPYKLGFVKTLVNPCPQCKAEGYNLYEVFKQGQTSAESSDNDNDKK